MDKTPQFLQDVSSDELPEMFHHLRILEAILFASENPLSFDELSHLMPQGVNLSLLLEKLEATYRHRGLVLEKQGSFYAFRTASDLATFLAPFRQENRKLSRQASETLAIIAYHQPVTRAEIEDIRGVSLSRGILDTLVETGWVRLGGRRQSPGRPVTYKTTPAFLDYFGLDGLENLPGITELKAAGFFEGADRLQGLEPPRAGGDEDELTFS